MPKRVLIAIDFDYDPVHPDDLMDVVQISQQWSDLPDDAAHEQTRFLHFDEEWRHAFTEAVINALTGAPTHFGSDQN